MSATTQDAVAAPAGKKAVNPWLIAPVVAMAAFMEVLDLSIANVALPHIAGSLSAGQSQSTWILTAYLVTNAIILPISGWLSQVLGRKRYFLMCIVGFGLSSLACGISPTLYILIIARAIQGLTGGGLQPAAQAILSDAFPPAKRAMAFAIYGMAVVVAPAVGPTFGGWITDNFSWHWIFLINIPVSIILFFVASAVVEDPPHLVEMRERYKRDGLKVDYLGFTLLAVGFGALQVMLDKGQEEDWFSSPLIVVCALLTFLCLGYFVLWVLDRDDPIVDLRLLKNRNFAMANIMMFLLGFVLLGSTSLLPQFVQALLGYTATDAGLVISPGGAILIVLMPIVGRLTGKVDARLLIGFGLVVSASGLLLTSHLSLDADYASVALCRLIQAAGLGFLFIPITSMAYIGIPREKSNAASAIINLSRNLGGSVGIALLITQLARGTQVHQNMLVHRASEYNPAWNTMVANLQGAFQAQGYAVAEAFAAAQAKAAAILGQQAQTLAYLDNFRYLAFVFFAMIPLVFILRKPKHDPSAEAPPAH
ncbi:DHA2 family efflux MFS transporter permease subunit [Radicibacter daui]|uniref:DHA2 family efflux MFS transporter permease subunit n=1 Tax=Radicibacter daui TaxID=3064829 RepID=UPI0040469BBA